MPDNTPRDEEMRAKLQSLDARIRAHSRKDEKDDAEARKKSAKGLALAYRVVIEIVAGFLVGYFIGKMLDNMLETAPFLTIICLLLGMGGAFVNIYRAALR